MTTPTRTLSIRQPWASLILGGWKDIENRSWRTGHRGPLWIHATAAAPDPWCWGSDVPACVTEALLFLPSDLPRAGVLGSVELLDCVEDCESPWFAGPWGWVLGSPLVLPAPVPMRGALGLWAMPQSLSESMAATLRPST